jgi:hypothetical protein
MKRTFNIVIALLLVLVIQSCETVVDLKIPEHKQLLVPNCFFNPDSFMEIQLSTSKGSLDNNQKINTVNGATIQIFENGLIKEILVQTGDGIYKANNFKPQAGKSYQVKINVGNYDEVDATNTIPTAVPINNFSFKDSAFIESGGGGGYVSQITLNISDPANEQNYYTINVFTYDTMFLNFPPGPGDTLIIARKLYAYSEDPNTTYSSYAEVMLNDELINGQNYSFKINFSSYEIFPNSKITAVLQSVSKELFLYTTTLTNQQNNQGNPFSEPVRVYSNINKGLGIFAGFSSSTVIVR